jgi:outer membrane protein OmpA-like peptidoglycan-associated protein
VNAEGYLFSSHSFDLTNDSLSAYQEIKKDIDLDKLKVGSRVVLKNIFFDYDKATLRSESIAELNRLKRIMQDNPSMKIEIGGHTDSRGADEYNNRLSKDRAQSVVNYLIENGIDKDRMTYKGYGKSQPVATNETPEGRQENRRVEFKIMSK